MRGLRVVKRQDHGSGKRQHGGEHREQAHLGQEPGDEPMRIIASQQRGKSGSEGHEKRRANIEFGSGQVGNNKMAEASQDEKTAVANQPSARASTSTWTSDLEPYGTPAT
jgi:hypothetical protein